MTFGIFSQAKSILRAFLANGNGIFDCRRFGRTDVNRNFFGTTIYFLLNCFIEISPSLSILRNGDG